MRMERKDGGFTLIEVAVVIGVLGVLLLVVATLMTGTMDAYAKISRETDTIKQARRGLEIISRDVRECIAAQSEISNPLDSGPLAVVSDAMLIASARRFDPITNSDNVFSVTGDGFPDPQSLVLYYVNTTPEGISQLVRHQLDFTQDLAVYPPPFTLLPAPGPHVGGSIVLVDSIGNQIAINRNSGNIGVTPPFKPPQVLVNGCTSLDAIAINVVLPVEVRLTVQLTNQYGHTVTTRLETQIDPRNT